MTVPNGWTSPSKRPRWPPSASTATTSKPNTGGSNRGADTSARSARIKHTLLCRSGTCSAPVRPTATSAATLHQPRPRTPNPTPHRPARTTRTRRHAYGGGRGNLNGLSYQAEAQAASGNQCARRRATLNATPKSFFRRSEHVSQPRLQRPLGVEERHGAVADARQSRDSRVAELRGRRGARYPPARSCRGHPDVAMDRD